VAVTVINTRTGKLFSRELQTVWSWPEVKKDEPILLAKAETDDQPVGTYQLVTTSRVSGAWIIGSIIDTRTGIVVYRFRQNIFVWPDKKNTEQPVVRLPR
jgi:hypothetical protein